MTPKEFSDRKIKILSKTDGDEIVKFLKTLPENVFKDIRSKVLPKATAPGFRKEHKKTYFAQISKALELAKRGKGEKIFAQMWLNWVVAVPTTLDGGVSLNDILKEFDNDDDFDDQEVQINPANSELDIACFEFLKRKNRLKLIDKETINYFYRFGYFEVDERIENIINECLSFNEIQVLKYGWIVLDNYKDKIVDMDETLEDLTKQSAKRDSKINVSEKKVKEYLGKLDKDLSLNLEIRKKVDSVDTEVQGFRKTLSKKNEELLNLQKKMAKAQSDLQLLLEKSHKERKENKSGNGLISEDKLLNKLRDYIRSEIGRNEKTIDSSELMTEIRDVVKKEVALISQAETFEKKIVSPKSKLPLYPSMEVFEQQLSTVLQLNDQKVAKIILASILSGDVLVASQYVVSKKIAGLVNENEMKEFYVESIWEGSKWFSNTTLDKELISPVVLLDFDRTFPELYGRPVFNSSTNDCVFFAVESEDEFRVSPGPSFWGSAFDLSPFLAEESNSRKHGPPLCILDSGTLEKWRKTLPKNENETVFSVDFRSRFDSLIPLKSAFWESLDRCASYYIKDFSVDETQGILMAAKVIPGICRHEAGYEVCHEIVQEFFSKNKEQFNLLVNHIDRKFGDTFVLEKNE